MRGPGSWKSSSGGADFSTASALFKPDVRISRIRLARNLSVQGMHRVSDQSFTTGAGQGRAPGGRRTSGLPGRGKALTPTSQMMTQSFEHIRIELVEATAGIAVAEVATPAFQKALMSSIS